MVRLFKRPIEGGLAAKLWRVPWLIVAVIALLGGVGTVTLYSVAGGSLAPWAETHALRFLIASAAMIALALVPLKVWSHIAYPVYGLALLLLALVPVMGSEVLGARRWLEVGGISLQPAELMKVGLVLALARHYSGPGGRSASHPSSVLLPAVMIVVPVVLTLRQPDLGSAALFAAIGIGTMLLAGVSWVYVAAGAVVGWLGSPVIWSMLHDYQRRRIEVFLDPGLDPLGAGYHIQQSKIALGSGGGLGKGYMQGTQSQLDFLPEKHTDFIFTMYAEEWGFVGAVALLAVFALLVGLLVSIALRTRSPFGRLAACGAALSLFTYVFINVAMVTGLVPVVGVPLPFVSYGGTSLVTLMALVGVAMSVHVHREVEAPGAWRSLDLPRLRRPEWGLRP